MRGRVNGTSLVLASAVLALCGCGSEPTAPGMSPAGHGPTLSVSPVTVHEIVPVEGDIYNSCVAEWIHIQGSLNRIGHSTRTTDGWYQTMYRLQLQGVSGIGATTGDLYQVRSSWMERINAVASNQTPYQDHYAVQERLIRERDGMSWAMRILWQITWKPDGTRAVLVDEVSMECPS